MSAKNSRTTADYLAWDSMLNLVRRLYRDGEYRMSLLIGCGAFFGLRISDLLTLNWTMLLSGGTFIVTEKKTGKHREIKINEGFQSHIRDCYNALGVGDMSECFRMGGDEFLVAMTAETEDVQARVALFNCLVSKWSGRYVDRLTVSYGIASAKEYPGLNFEELLKTADNMMYDSKKQQTGCR